MNANPILATFTSTARDENNLERLTTMLVGLVDEFMQPRQANFWLRVKYMILINWPYPASGLSFGLSLSQVLDAVAAAMTKRHPLLPRYNLEP